jgi:hypothetical protein
VRVSVSTGGAGSWWFGQEKKSALDNLKFGFVCMRPPMMYEGNDEDEVYSDGRGVASQQRKLKLYEPHTDRWKYHPGKENAQSMRLFASTTVPFSCRPGRPGFYCGGCTIQGSIGTLSESSGKKHSYCDESFDDLGPQKGLLYRGCQNVGKYLLKTEISSGVLEKEAGVLEVTASSQ